SALYQRQSLSIHDSRMVTLYKGNIPGVFPATNALNTQVFDNDVNFLLIGDDHGDTLVNQCSSSGRFSMMDRTWKVQVTGNPGIVTLALDKASVPPEITALLVASDPGFTTNLQSIPIQDNGTELYASVTFANNAYFTFGSLPME